MIRESFKKSEYKPIEKVDENAYHLMWNKVDVMNIEYQMNEDGSRVLDEEGNPIIIGQTETDYCKCIHETINLPKNMTNILEMIEMGKKIGYVEPSIEEYAAWMEVLGGNINWLKDRVKAKVLEFDSSTAVNEFTIGGAKVWLDKATRVGLKLRFEGEKGSGATHTTLWYNGVSFTLNVDDAINMLFAIEMYASACYDKTQEHLANIDKIETVAELIEYDYTIGYPSKLEF